MKIDENFLVISLMFRKHVPEINRANERSNSCSS